MSDFIAVVYVPDPLTFLLLLWQGVWIVLGSKAGALRPHKRSWRHSFWERHFGSLLWLPQIAQVFAKASLCPAFLHLGTAVSETSKGPMSL